MEKFTTVAGPAAPMLTPNVDTDVIIPIQRLVGSGRTGLGPHAFERLRYNKDDKFVAARTTLAAFLNPFSNDGDPFTSPFVGTFDADPGVAGNQAHTHPPVQSDPPPESPHRCQTPHRCRHSCPWPTHTWARASDRKPGVKPGPSFC